LSGALIAALGVRLPDRVRCIAQAVTITVTVEEVDHCRPAKCLIHSVEPLRIIDKIRQRNADNMLSLQIALPCVCVYPSEFRKDVRLIWERCRRRKTFDDMFSRFDTTPECFRGTDRRTNERTLYQFHTV